MAIQVTDVHITKVNDEVKNIRKLVKSQQEVLSNFRRLIGQMEGNWRGQGYAQYTKLFSDVAPKNEKMLKKIEEMNETIAKLVAELDEVDRKSASSFNTI